MNTRVGLVIVAMMMMGREPADACINPMRIAKDQAVAVIARAESLIADGQYPAALTELGGAEPVFVYGWLQYEVRDEVLQRKLELLAATAALRTGGAHTPHARDTLEDLLSMDAENPVLIARVAEARMATAFDERDRAAALAALTDLAQRDLMPDAESYAVLARLRLADHDDVGATAAHARCAAMARRPAICADLARPPTAAAPAAAAAAPAVATPAKVTPARPVKAARRGAARRPR